MELLLLLLSLSLVKYQYVCELPWAASHHGRVENNMPLQHNSFSLHTPDIGGKATEPPALSHLSGFREPFKVKPTGDYCLCRARFFSIPRLSSPLLSTITRRHKIRRLLTASDHGCIQGVSIIFPHLRSRSCDNRLFTPQPFVTRQYAAHVAHINLREE